MHVSAILGEKGSTVYSVGPDDSVEVAIATLGSKRIGAVLVLETERVCGVFSERDVVRALLQNGSETLRRPVRDFMSTDVISCTRGESIDSLMTLMTEKRIRHLPVVEEGRLLGMISIGDVVKFRIAEAEAETDALKSYIASGR